MIDPKSFKVPFIPREKAWSEAERIRREHWPSGAVPVEVEEVLWGVGLELTPVHSLKHPYSSVDEWIEFVQSIPEDQYGYIEQHAYEFAGRLLVPVERLRSELASAVNRAQAAGFMEWDRSGDAAREHIGSSICRIFGVSSQVIEKRIVREQLWPPTR